MQQELIKDKIRLSFNRAYNTYDNYCMLQSDICEKLILQLKQYISSANSVVDFGCGTGNSTRQLVDNLSCKKICAVDIADKLLAKAEHKLVQHHVDVLIADFEQVIFKNNSINLAFSNMALQWSTNLKKTFDVLYAQLADEGLFAFSMPIDETFFELEDDCKNKFFRRSEILLELLNSGFRVLSSSDESYTLPFSLPNAALKSIKMVGANCLLDQNPENNLFNRKLSEMFKSKDNYSLTYNIGFFIVMKGSKHVT